MSYTAPQTAKLALMLLSDNTEVEFWIVEILEPVLLKYENLLFALVISFYTFLFLKTVGLGGVFYFVDFLRSICCNMLSAKHASTCISASHLNYTLYSLSSCS